MTRYYKFHPRDFANEYVICAATTPVWVAYYDARGEYITAMEARALSAKGRFANTVQDWRKWEINGEQVHVDYDYTPAGRNGDYWRNYRALIAEAAV
jgi:hypothetical protein